MTQSDSIAIEEEEDNCTNWVNVKPRYGVICGDWCKDGNLYLCDKCLESDNDN